VEGGGAVRDLALSPDDRYLIAAGDDGEIGGVLSIWDTEEARWTHVLSVTTSPDLHDEVYAVTFSPDGHYLVGGGDYDPDWRDYDGETAGIVRIWELGRRGDALLPTAVLTLTEPTGRVNSLASWMDASPIEARNFSESYYLAAAANDDRVWLWELAPMAPGAVTVTRKISLTGHTADVDAVAFSPTDPILASASADRTIRLWDLATATPRLTLVGHTAGVTSLSFSPDGRYLVSGARDRTVRVWDVGARNPNAITTLTGPESLVLSIAFDPQGNTVAAGSGDLSVHIWDMNFPREMRLSTLTGHSASARDVAFSPDGVFLASGDDRGETRVWSLRAGRTIVRMPVVKEKMWSLAYSPNGQYIATGFDDHTVRIWDPATGALLATLEAHADDVEGLVFTPAGDRLITVADDKQAIIWNTTAWKMERAFGIPAGIWDLTSDPAGKWLIGGYSQGHIYLWEMQRTGEGALSLVEPLTLTTGTAPPVVGLEVSPDGRYLAAGSWDTHAYLWDLDTLQPVARPLNHPGYVYDVAFSPTGDYLATGSRDGVVRLWSLKNFPAEPPELVGLYAGHTDLVWDVAFSPDGQYLVSSSWDGTIRRYLVPFDDVLDLATRYANVNENWTELSASEGERYD
jgi:WD40 repeat protein